MVTTLRNNSRFFESENMDRRFPLLDPDTGDTWECSAGLPSLSNNKFNVQITAVFSAIQGLCMDKTVPPDSSDG
jgi:hypothetical protein